MKLPLFGIRRILPKRIWQQIFFILFFLTIIPLGVLWILLLQTSQNAIKTTILRDYKEVAIHATGEIKENIKGARGSLSMTASILGALHADSWRQETAIVELSLKDSAFERISSLNLDGDEIATSQLGTELRDRSNEKAFQDAALGKPYLSEVKISENHIPYLTIAEPIKQFGKVNGVIIADLNLRSVWGIIDGIQIGRLGQAYLIDRQGRIIAHQDKKKVLKNANVTHAQVVRDVLLDKTGNLDTVDEHGESWLTSYAPVKKLNWGLIITQPESEAFAFSKEMNTQFLTLIALGVPVMLLVSFILARYMSRPIQDMVEGTKRISRGDFSQFFQIRSRGEIDRLLYSFNRMTHKLRKAQADEKLSIIGKASTVIAHELKNSLQLIDTFIKLLPERQGDKEFIKKFADTIPKELDSWNTSLKNMMTFSRNFRFLITKVDINTMIEEMVLLAKLKTQQLNIQLEVNLGNRLPLIMGNKEKLKQVLLNIVTNALEATPSGGRITFSTKVINGFNRRGSKHVRGQENSSIPHPGKRSGKTLRQAQVRDRDLSPGSPGRNRWNSHEIPSHRETLAGQNERTKKNIKKASQWLNYVEIEIINTGAGIDKKRLNKIFEPFYSTKNGGLGLGLSISKEIIEYHNGSLEVVSGKGEKTAFKIQVPINHIIPKSDTVIQKHG